MTVAVKYLQQEVDSLKQKLRSAWKLQPYEVEHLQRQLASTEARLEYQKDKEAKKQAGEWNPMATRKKPPTRKQLIARKKFVKMVRARARALKAAKRGRRNTTPVKRRVAVATKRANPRRKLTGLSVRKGGRKLYGAAAAAVLRKRGKKNPRFGPKGEKVYQAIKKAGAYGKRTKSVAAATARKLFGKNPRRKRGVLLTNRKPNGMFGRAVKRAVSRRLHAPIRFRRRRNPNGTPEGIAEIHQTFLGRPTEGHFEITAPQGTPKDVAVLGSLVCLKTEDEDFEFDKGEAYLGADERGNLYVLGDTTPVETNATFGHIEEIRYEAKKDHLNPFRWKRRKRNSGNVEYYHYFGEEDGVMPKLKSDSDGLLHISGGNYKVEAEGIIN